MLSFIDKINPTANKICEILSKEGYEAYLVGGCVRDLIREQTPHDWDICTSALPDKIIEVFSNKSWTVVPTGIKYGTITVIEPVSKERFEVTTFRKESSYSDGRHPDEVSFKASLIDDLSRRDFTMNAIALKCYPEYELIDPFHGEKDIRCWVIRCVGDPTERFGEDALRMLRAIRFSSQLKFLIDKSVEESIISCSDLLSSVSKERIRDELVKILLSDMPAEGISNLRQTRLLQYVVPELDACYGCTQSKPWHLYDVFGHTLLALSFMKDRTKDLATRLAILYHDVGKPSTKSVGPDGTFHFYSHPKVSASMTRISMFNLRFDNEIINQVESLILQHDRHMEPSRKGVRRIIRDLYSHELLPKLVEIRRADVLAQNPALIKDRISRAEECLKIYRTLIDEEVALSVKDLKINGHDVMTFGFKGKEVGAVLKDLLNLVIDEEIANEREVLLSQIELRSEKSG